MERASNEEHDDGREEDAERVSMPDYDVRMCGGRGRTVHLRPRVQVRPRVSLRGWLRVPTPLTHRPGSGPSSGVL